MLSPETAAPVGPRDAPPRVAWADFARQLDWRQGEHAALIGPTGQGKTTLANALASYRLDPPRNGHVVQLATKARDDTIAHLRRRGWQQVRQFSDRRPGRRVLVWPKYVDPSSEPAQAHAFRAAIREVFRAGAWCVVADDVQYLTDHLGLRRDLASLWLQARSLGVTVVGATQRPVNAPREMFSQSSHYFLWGTADDHDLRSLSGLGMADSSRVRRIVTQLAPHDVLYVDGRRANTLCVTRAPKR